MTVFEKHIADLARRSYERNYNTFSEFMNLDEISILYSLKLPVPFILYGGYEGAERCVACFFSDENEIAFPVKCLKISPVNSKFADRLSHRDYLGSLMNLGINRNTLGDIVVKDNIGYVFCLESISGYITENLTRIKHTTVICEEAEITGELIADKPQETELTAPSLRADAVCAAVYKLSRKAVSEYFSHSDVFINSRVCVKESTLLKSGDRVSVRGKGKFIFNGEIRETKRNRKVLSVSVYK